MLRANEIRIGNLVTSESLHEGDYYIVSIIDTNFINRDSVLKYEMLQGIPLTEEWLMKMGFEKRGITYCISLSPKTWGYLTVEPIDWSFSIDSSPNDSTIPSEELKGLHQLQNLYFALTGEELTVK